MDKNRRMIQLGKTATAILAGEENVAEWDDEELVAGRRRDKHGGFSGRSPMIIPRAVHQELVRRRIPAGRS